MTVCRDCGQEITFIEVNGRNYPCDPDEVEHDDVDDGLSMVCDEAIVRVSAATYGFGISGYLVHFDTCTRASDQRKYGRRDRR